MAAFFLQGLREAEGLDESEQVSDSLQGAVHVLLPTQDAVLGLHAFLSGIKQQG